MEGIDKFRQPAFRSLDVRALIDLNRGSPLLLTLVGCLTHDEPGTPQLVEPALQGLGFLQGRLPAAWTGGRAARVCSWGSIGFRPTASVRRAFPLSRTAATSRT